MAFVCVDKDGREWICSDKPSREPYTDDGYQADSVWCSDEQVELPKGSIVKLIGRELTWSDEPVMIE